MSEAPDPGADPDSAPGPAKPRQPLFLARRSYRRRRLMDASRFLPALGLFLFLLPVVWEPEGGGPPSTAEGVVYIFLVWFGLIVVALVFAHGLAPAVGEEPGATPDIFDEER